VTDHQTESDGHSGGHTAPSDAGKTSGGGSSGHDQPEDVSRQTAIRNQPKNSGKTGAQRETP
jgi:hypothetical protein